MLPYAPPPSTPIANRPEVFDKQDGPTGRSFRIRFAPNQVLPDHRNSSPLTITVEAGSGTFTVDGEGVHSIAVGDQLEVEVNRMHSAAAGDGGMILHVVLTAITGECC